MQSETSLVVQWLRLWAFTEEDLGLIPGPGKFRMLSGEAKIKKDAIWFLSLLSWQSPMAPYISLGEKLKTLPDSVRYSTPAVPLHTHTHISDCGLCTIPCLLPHSNHWRREWQTTSEFLPWEPHEQHEKAKWQASLTRWTRVWVNSGSWCWTGRPGDSWGCKELDTTERLNWTELNWTDRL